MRAPDKLNMHRSFDFYENSGTKSRLSYLDFAAMLIHSEVFLTLVDEDGDGQEVAVGFAVASDRTRNSFLSVFSVSDLLLYVRKLAEDDVVERLLLRDGRGNVVEVGSNKPLSGAEMERFFSQHGKGKKRQEILDFLAGRIR